jgi:HSP20 family protein
MGRQSFPFHGIFSSIPATQGRTQPVPEPELVFEPESAPEPKAAVGQVAVDIHEQDGYYIIKAPIAGVRMADIDIEVNENVLIIRGERRQPDDAPADQYLVQECFWGPFERRVTLPGPIDQRRVKATFNKESILKILVPREREEQRIKIVRVGDA